MARNKQSILEILVLVIVAALFAPALIGVAAVVAFTPALVRAAKKVGSYVRNKQSEEGFKADKRQNTKRHGRNVVVDNSLLYDNRRQQWNIAAFPLELGLPNDKHVNGTTAANSNVRYFDCCGIKDFVTGVAHRNGTADFSFKCKDFDNALKIEAYLKANESHPSLRGASIRRDVDGGFVCNCRDPHAIVALVKAGQFQPKDATVTTVTRDVKQFIVSGCETYEEALAKFEANRSNMSPANAYSHIESKLNDRFVESVGYNPLRPSRMEVGSFIIDVVREHSSTLTGTVPGAQALSDKEIADSLLVNKEIIPETSESKEFVSLYMFSDKEKANMAHFVRFGNGRTLDVDKIESQAAAAAADISNTKYLTVTFQTKEELQEALERGYINKKSFMEITDGRNDREIIQEGGFQMHMPLDDKTLKRLHVTGDDSDSIGRYSGLGISPATLEMACIGVSMKETGHCPVVNDSVIPISGFSANGTRVEELKDRIGNDNAPQLDSLVQINQWSKQAAMIQNIDIDVDLKDETLRIRSTVSNGVFTHTKTETKKLSAKELEDFSRRDPITSSQAKDLFMQTHPNYFSIYRSGGKSIFSDPIGDFMAGRKPKTKIEAYRQKKSQKNVHKTAPKRTIR